MIKKEVLAKSVAIAKTEVILSELKLAGESKTEAEFDRHIHLARLAVAKVRTELHWYFGTGDIF